VNVGASANIVEIALQKIEKPIGVYFVRKTKPELSTATKRHAIPVVFVHQSPAATHSNRELTRRSEAVVLCLNFRVQP
jgi:hypothetical protein